MSSQLNELPAAVPAVNLTQVDFVIRHARYRDLTAISKVLKAAFWYEDSVGRFMHPKREEYPTDVERFWKLRLRSVFVDWQHDLIVAVDTKSGEILGTADWCRIGPGAKKIKGNGWRWTFRYIFPPLVKLVNSVSQKLHPNRASTDPSRLTAFARSHAFTAHLWNPPRNECWDLVTLGVLPSHQGKGIGRSLVAWGMKQVVDEDVAASVVSAYGKDNFYKLCGFDVVVGNATEGEGNPLAGIKGGNILFRDRKTVCK